MVGFIPGHSIPPFNLGSVTLTECAATCNHTIGCAAFVWREGAEKPCALRSVPASVDKVTTAQAWHRMYESFSKLPDGAGCSLATARTTVTTTQVIAEKTACPSRALTGFRPVANGQISGDVLLRVSGELEFSVNDCASACAARAACFSFHWHEEQKTCELKAGAGTKVLSSAPGQLHYQGYAKLECAFTGDVAATCPNSGMLSSYQPAGVGFIAGNFIAGISNSLADVPSVEECAAVCLTLSSCVSFHWSEEVKTCAFKRAQGTPLNIKTDRSFQLKYRVFNKLDCAA